MNDLMVEVANDVTDIKQKLNTQDIPKQMEANVESNKDQVDSDSERLRSYSKVVRASLEATMPKWKFNLLVTVKGHSKFFNEIVATKPGMINMLSEFGDIKMDDMEAVSLLYSGEVKKKFLICFKNLDSRTNFWKLRSRFGSLGVFIDCDLPLSQRSIRSDMLKELFNMNKRLQKLNGSRITFYKQEWGVLVLGRRFDFTLRGAVNKMRALLIDHYKQVRDPLRKTDDESSDSSDIESSSEDDDDSSSEEDDKVAGPAARTWADSIARSKQPRLRRPPCRYHTGKS